MDEEFIEDPQEHIHQFGNDPKESDSFVTKDQQAYIQAPSSREAIPGKKRGEENTLDATYKNTSDGPR